MKVTLTFGAVLFIISSQTWGLTLEQFKAQVYESNPQYKSIIQTKSFAQQISGSESILIAPQLVSQSIYSDDKRITLVPSTQGTETKYREFSLGIQQNNEYGIQWNILLENTRTQIYGTMSNLLGYTDFNDISLAGNVKISLWRNLFGSETRSNLELISKKNETQFLKAKVEETQLNIDLEESFYKLYYAQEKLNLAEDMLKRSQKLVTWAEGKLKKNLIDLSDSISIQSAEKTREIDLQEAQSNLNIAQEQLNLKRGVQPDTPVKVESKAQFDFKSIQLMSNTEKQRIDLKLKNNTAEVEQSQLKVNEEIYKPNLDFTFSYGRYGRGENINQAQNSWRNDQQNVPVVMLSFAMPINQIKYSAIRSEYEEQIQSVYLNKSANQLDSTLSWSNLKNQINLVMNQLNSIYVLEELNHKKSDLERDKLNKGRTTTFQVISYEQDYLSTRAKRILLEQSMQNLISQTNFFE